MMQIPIFQNFIPIFKGRKGWEIDVYPLKTLTLVRGDWEAVARNIATDLAAEGVPGTLSNFSLPSGSPTGFSITSAGVLTAEYPHNGTAEMIRIDFQADGNKRRARLPLSVREYRLTDHFPANLPDTDRREIRSFYSTWHSHDGGAHPLIDVRIINANGTDNQTVTLRTGADGYLDILPLRTAIADVSNVFFTIPKFYDLGTEAADLNADANTQEALFGYKLEQDTDPVFFSENEQYLALGEWDLENYHATAFDNVGTRKTCDGARYSGGNETFNAGNESYAFGAIIRKRVTTRETFIWGDENGYPGMADISATQIRFETQEIRLNATLSQSTHWAHWVAYRVSTGVPGSDQTKRILVHSLQDLNINQSEPLTDSYEHGGSGRRLHFNDIFVSDLYLLGLANLSSLVNWHTDFDYVAHEKYASYTQSVSHQFNLN